MRAAPNLAWLAAACVGLAACSVKPVDLTGKSCPCAPGYSCDDNNKCVKSLDGTGGASATGGEGGTGGEDQDGGGTGGNERDSGGGGVSGRPDGAMPYDAAGLPDTGMGFDAALTFDAGPMCPSVMGGGTCPQGCSRCEGTTCIIDCDYPYACGLVQPPCPAGWGCTVICSGPGACAAPFSMRCADGPCLLQCGVSTCLGASMDCGTGACEVRCEGGSKPAVNCGDACSCTQPGC